MDHILSLSYGKDSLACLGAIEQLGWPLDRIVHVEVWATDTIPADLPPMVEFKKKADKIILDRWGIEVERICATTIYKNDPECNTFEKGFYHELPDRKFTGAVKGWSMQRHPWCNKLKLSALNEAENFLVKKTYQDMFYHVREKGSRKGQICGFPFPGYPECNGTLKRPVFDKIEKQDCVSYVGIAADEPKRFGVLKKKKRSPLVEAGWTEAMCREWCEENDLLSPIYTTSNRGGCWFCHNQGVDQLRQLRHNYPEYWKLMLKWDNDSPVSFKADGHTVHDFDKRFKLEDEGYIKPGECFRWAMLDEELNGRLF